MASSALSDLVSMLEGSDLTQQPTAYNGRRKQRKPTKTKVAKHPSAADDAESEEPRTAAARKKSKKHLKVATGGGVKRPHRFRPGTVALREIKKEQKSTKECVPKLPMERVIREIAQDYGQGGVRFTKSALEALRVSAEAMLIERFNASQTLACSFRQKSLSKRSFDFVNAILGQKL
jgi:histone H3